MKLPAKTPVVGTPISMTSYEEVIDLLDQAPSDRAMTIAICTVHSVMTARRDPALRNALDNADIATCDGMPLVWAIRMTARPDQQRVYGPELMRRTLAAGRPEQRHYLFGSTPETIELLQERAADFAPSTKIVGTESPPFRAPTPEEEESMLERIRSSGANVVWVGLGMPKQELWMARVAQRLPGITLVGVGAAFDFLAETKAQAPAWMQRSGLEWLFRLSQEPRRLWRRYVWNNPAYLVLLARQVAMFRFRGGHRSPEKAD
jgi:N-acetylglucosaminyldiphosphoundecaprenol N-acetyl-beta-D-mannosaminyltransferase